MSSFCFRFRAGRHFFLVLLLLTGMALRSAAQDMAIYTDSLQNTWSDWSWNATRNFANTGTYVHGGSQSISVTITNGYGALSLHHDGGNINTANYSSLNFWIHGGTAGGQLLQVYAELNGVGQPTVSLPALTTGWQQVTLSMASLGIANQPNFTRFSIQDRSGAASSTFYVDDIVLVTNGTPPPIVTLTSPSSGASFAAPASINLAATVVTNGHAITKVQFYSNGSTLLGEDTTAPYGLTWSGMSVGSYSLTARVIFDAGASIDSSAAAITVTGTSAASISVDGHLNRHAISPQIYGVAFPGSSSQLTDLNFTLSRSGGNAETRYNWLIDAHNRGGDWFFESIGDSPTGTPGASDDSFVSLSKGGGADALLTVPMIGWMPKLGPSRAHLSSFSVSKYGAQQAVDPYWTDAGNGVSLVGGTNIVNDPTDANFPTNSNFQLAWLRHLTSTWGASTNGGVKYYLMDNEHSIWQSTHRDVHPVGPSMQEIRDKIIDYGSLVKSNDPNALVGAPEEWGWSGYFFSGYDQQNSGNKDRGTNGGWDYCPWLLNQLHLHDVGTGQRLLDYFTLHCYPQGKYNTTNNEFGNDVSTATQILRNQSTRQFWDTNYVDQSWIGVQAANNILMLIPRMRGWVNTYYPGTKIGITEYNWGAEGYINGATAQADILGIFGRENLDLATRWTTPATGSLCYNAMKIYRNYDGSKSTFGDTSISAGGPNPDNVSTFAAIRSTDGALTLMVINKQLNNAAVLTVNLANFAPNGTAQVWQLTSANTIGRLTDLAFSGNSFSNTVPAQSITLFVLPAGTPPAPLLTNPAMPVANNFTFNLVGQSGLTYIIQSSTNLINWLSVQTNLLAGPSTNLLFSAPDKLRFYRAVWLP
jgi:hypothetical protein